MRKCAGFLYGLDLHHLDHLAPFCSLLSIPLICTHETPFSMAKKFYPNLAVELHPETDVIVEKYDVLFTCLPKELIDPVFFFDEHKLRKKLLSIWLPHGNSDKDNLEALAKEKIVLAYGPQMVEMLTKKNVLSRLFQYILLGNFRAHFFEQHRAFYNSLLNKRISFSKGTTLLYAPTWNHSNVEKDLPLLLKTLPPTYNLFVKLHPNTLTKSFHLPLRIQYEDKENIRFVDDIPTIYPLLNKTDILITDTSSIAYDFLFFDRPIFFFTSERTPIHRTGYISKAITLFEDLEREDIFDDARRSLYHYAFSETVHYDALPLIIKTTFNTYFDNELHFL